MEQEAYRELCRATSLALGINDTESLFDTGQLEIDGIEFGIFLNRRYHLIACSVISTWEKFRAEGEKAYFPGSCP